MSTHDVDVNDEQLSLQNNNNHHHHHYYNDNNNKQSDKKELKVGLIGGGNHDQLNNKQEEGNWVRYSQLYILHKTKRMEKNQGTAHVGIRQSRRQTVC